MNPWLKSITNNYNSLHEVMWLIQYLVLKKKSVQKPLGVHFVYPKSDVMLTL